MHVSVTAKAIHITKLTYSNKVILNI